MEILNIGPLELIIILLLMFVLLGPKEMLRTAYRVGRWIRNFVRSPMWKEILGYSQEIRELPQKIMEESGLEETVAEIKQSTQAAADELNSQLKEVTEAARVPEVEHLKLDTASQPETPSIKPDTSASKPEPVPFQGEAAAAEAAVSPETMASTEAVVSPETVIPPETAAPLETVVYRETPVLNGVTTSREIAVPTESVVSDETAISLETANSGEAAAVVPTDLQPAAPIEETPPPAIVGVAVGIPVMELKPAVEPPVEEPPAPRKRRTKTAQVEGEAPAAPRTRRKKQAEAETVVAAVETTPEAAGTVEPAAEPAPTPRKGRQRKTVPPIDGPVTAPKGIGADAVQPENGKVVESFPPQPETAPASKPRARRTTRPTETPTNGNGAQPDPEQVTSSDAA